MNLVQIPESLSTQMIEFRFLDDLPRPPLGLGPSNGAHIALTVSRESSPKKFHLRCGCQIFTEEVPDDCMHVDWPTKQAED